MKISDVRAATVATTVSTDIARLDVRRLACSGRKQGEGF